LTLTNVCPVQYIFPAAVRDLGGKSRASSISSNKPCRVRKIEERLPHEIQVEIDTRLAEIARLLASVAPDIQGINRHRYARSLVCLEELVEALTFCHYLKTQTLISCDQLIPVVDNLTRQGLAGEDEVMADSGIAGIPDSAPESAVEKDAKDLVIGLTDDEFLYGVFDLTGEMMRFATTTSALTGKMASSDAVNNGRDIVQDMHDLGSFFEMLPPRTGNRGVWEKKLTVTRQSVQKVEKLGYDLKVRGSERPKGWVPDLSTIDQPGSPEA